MRCHFTRRLGVIAATAAMLAAACSSSEPGARPVESAAEAVTEAPVPTTEATGDTAAATTATAESADTADTAAPTTTQAVAPVSPEITVTSGPTGTTTGRDEHGEGGVFRVDWDVDPAEADCSFSLNDVDGNSVVHDVTGVTGAGETARTLEVLYSVTLDGLPIMVTLTCRTDDGAGTVVGLPVQIVEPGEETTDAEAETESEPKAVTKNYENRSADSVLPATDDFYFDHDEIRALFPECPPGKWSSAAAEEWFYGFVGMLHALYDGWDTEVVSGRNGKQVVTGWWTDENLAARWIPAPLAAEAKKQVHINPAGDLNIWGGSTNAVSFPEWHLFPWRQGDDGFMLNLHDRLEPDDYEWERTPAFLWARDEGIQPHRAPPANVETAALIADWMVYRYQESPVTREPTPWAMRTLLEARDIECVSDEMKAICSAEELPESAHLRNDSGSSPLGRALWSIICGKGPRN